MCLQKILKNSIYLILTAWVLLAPLEVYALKSDTEKTANLNADKAVFDRSSNTQTYIGNVVYTQGSMHLTAERLQIITDNKNKVEKIVATGKQAHYSLLPDNSKYPISASANTIEYYPDKGIVKLMSNGKVNQSTNNFTGSDIVYSVDQQTVLSTTKDNNKTVIVFKP